MNDMRTTIVPKSDQMNADDLIGTTRTITVTGVAIAPGEQPVAISFEGDKGKPYKPGKSMRRVLVNFWGPDANAYVGRSMTLYRDDKVQFGGLDVGGIRISHLSHISAAATMALTATRGNKKAFKVQPLRVEQKQASARTDDALPPLQERTERTAGYFAAAMSSAQVQKLIVKTQGLMSDLEEAAEWDLKDRLVAAMEDARTRDFDGSQQLEPSGTDEPHPHDEAPFPGDAP